jgi:hypothetical protein
MLHTYKTISSRDFISAGNQAQVYNILCDFNRATHAHVVWMYFACLLISLIRLKREIKPLLFFVLKHTARELGSYNHGYHAWWAHQRVSYFLMSQWNYGTWLARLQIRYITGPVTDTVYDWPGYRFMWPFLKTTHTMILWYAPAAIEFYPKFVW